MTDRLTVRLRLARLVLMGLAALTGLSLIQSPIQSPVQAQTTASDPKAVAVAREMMAALGGQDTWDATRYTHFRVTRRGNTSEHTWDKRAHRYRFEGTNGEGQAFVTMIDMNTKQGTAYRGGQSLEGEDLEQALNMAFRAWHGSHYWALAPLKILEPGVLLQYDGEETIDGQEYDTIHLSFENVGITPDDQFWVSINKTTRLMDKWRFKLGGGAEGEFWWREWEEHGGLKIATIRARMDGTTEIELDSVGVTNELPDSWFTSPDPVQFP